MEVLEILQQTELQILAAAAGIREWYGLADEQALTEQETMYGVHELVRRGVLCSEEGVFWFSEPYRTIFLTLKTADRLLAVTGKEPEMQDFCLYCGEKLVVLEESRQDTAAVRIGICEWEDLYELMRERGFLPKPYVEADIAALQTVEEFARMLPEEIRRRLGQPGLPDLSKEGTEQLLAQYLIFDLKREKKQEPFQAFYLFENPCNYWIAEKDRQSFGFLRYDGDNLLESIRSRLL